MGDQSAPPQSDIPKKTKADALFDDSSEDDTYIELEPSDDEDPFEF